ncbi:23S rRNA (guanine(745)-N(1))-methyltransferase [Pseudoalteromonas sp. MMG010]|uniref:23S rRNA (guanine(745)-N(1))-methyltransferase n=1 Tax=Pseudoalteromonas sp. MMG010 TaxID=2822685 RepID=UPI001B3A7944|nr:23S rRNA (guanine(745)-N(1))-methyltransferase [Pseudoalteromonas sp. MMG010]MBQ4832562.1 23S rRNA (guanine(745)-N(1))-methyltransferase [Pseudoalteromonas sp. MMG010]
MSLDYLCPLCTFALQKIDNTLSCENRHSFDFAKEGYVNLLPVQNKNSKHPGDSLEMVQARRAFLEQGYYRFLQQALIEIVSDINADTLLDLGCGEGFYTHALAQHTQAQVYGVDISKSAIKFAAKRYPNCHFSVASISEAPFKSQFADILISVFAPLFEHELARLAKPNAQLIIASPGPWHLKELKELIYKHVNEHTEIQPPSGFEHLKTTLISQQVQLEFNELKNLIMMTPFAWKFRPEQWHALEQTASKSVTLSFYISQFKVKNS